MPRIALSVAALFVLAALPNLVSATNYPRASGTPSLYVSLNLSRQLSSLTLFPSSCFDCPATDMAGFPVNNPSDDGSILFCSYPAFSGEDPNDFFCTYNVSFIFLAQNLLHLKYHHLQSQRDGSLILDSDAGLCVGNALLVPCMTRRDDNFKAMKRRAEARHAKAQASRHERKLELKA
jgi:hypothetical protein